MGNCFRGDAPVAPEDDPDIEPPSVFAEPEKVSAGLNRVAHERLEKLKELDDSTKVPFILVELTGEGPGLGEIEICGKDEYGVYASLDDWLTSRWSCEKLDPGTEGGDTKVPFCKAQYKWPGYAICGDEGLNNMGLMTMQLVDFMCSTLSWTLAVVNSGSVGRSGEIKEQQIIFKAPHPMNMAAPHMMIELRSAGFVEVCADLEDDQLEILDSLDAYFAGRFNAEVLEGYDDFANRYYQVGEGVFKGTSGSLDSNFGLLTVEVCDTVVGFPGWSLVACNGGSYGEEGLHCEQQLVFRKDEHPLGDAAYLQLILNATGNIEVNGKQVRGVHSTLDHWLRKQWGCQRAGELQEGETTSRRYTWTATDMMDASLSIVRFFETKGWEVQVVSQQMVQEDGQQCREQQLFLRPGQTEVDTVEPHLFIELYAGEGLDELYEDEEEPTQVLANQHIRVRHIGGREHEELLEAANAGINDFITNYMGGVQAESTRGASKYCLNVFMCRGRYENNLAQWTMRVCDFLVDRLGWSFIVCSLCNMGECGQYRLQQLLFRFDGDKRPVPVSRPVEDLPLEEISRTLKPAHWTSEPVLNGEELHAVQTATRAELAEIQDLLDCTFKRTLTRDRAPDDDAPEDEEMPFRMEVKHAFRSEHAWLNHRFEERRAEAEAGKHDSTHFSVKTSAAHAPLLSARLAPRENYLFHGTNPSSAMSILKSGFVLDHAGSATGTMFGYGCYMAECSSKGDEYGRDDGGNTYPGLLALLVCKCYIGRPFMCSNAGDHVKHATDKGGFDVVCGDRETKVGTYREFIFFNEAQIYPEFAVIYRRQYVKSKVSPEMQVKATGTTGRAWQIGLGKDEGWKNLPMGVGKVLTQAYKFAQADDAAPSEVTIVFRRVEYQINVREKKGVNTKTDHEVRMRIPMQM